MCGILEDVADPGPAVADTGPHVPHAETASAAAAMPSGGDSIPHAAGPAPTPAATADGLASDHGGHSQIPGGIDHGLGGLFDQLASGQDFAPHGGEHHGLGELLSQIAHMEQHATAGQPDAHTPAPDFGDMYHAPAHLEPHHDFATTQDEHPLPAHAFDTGHHHY